MSAPFTIVRLLPQILGLNGSLASGEIVAVSLRHMGHDVRILDVDTPEDVPATPDLVCVGSGSTSSISPGAKALSALMPSLLAWKNLGTSWVAHGVGWDLLGIDVLTAQGDHLPGVGIFPSRADHRFPRFSGEVSGVDYRGRPSAGYLNAVGQSELNESAQPLMRLEHPRGAEPVHEGLRADNLLATRVGGPALALNPHWAGDIVEELLAKRGLEPDFGPFHERVELLATQARAKIVARLGAKN